MPDRLRVRHAGLWWVPTPEFHPSGLPAHRLVATGAFAQRLFFGLSHSWQPTRPRTGPVGCAGTSVAGRLGCGASLPWFRVAALRCEGRRRSRSHTRRLAMTNTPAAHAPALPAPWLPMTSRSRFSTQSGSTCIVAPWGFKPSLRPWFPLTAAFCAISWNAPVSRSFCASRKVAVVGLALTRLTSTPCPEVVPPNARPSWTWLPFAGWCRWSSVGAGRRCW